MNADFVERCGFSALAKEDLTPSPSRSACTWMFAGACLACALPTLSAVSSPPNATFFNQAAAVVGWGVWVCLWAFGAQRLPSTRWDERRSAGAGPLWGVLLILVGGVGWAAVGVLPISLALSAWGMLAAAGLALWFGQLVVRSGWAEAAFTALCGALVVAAVLNTGVALVQVLAPQAVDGLWMAQTSAAIAGRGAGNLRQPNHLSSLVLWGLVAVVWLQARGARSPARDGLWLALGLGLCAGVALSGSRTGTVGLLLLALWGGLDRRLAGRVRWCLVAAPVAYALMAWAVSVGLHAALAQEGRFSLQGDVSASRFGIWSNAGVLLQQHPWQGVGWGGFNWAWSLTPFPGRPVAFFDHAHNLALHFAVELGLPVALLLCGLLMWAFGRAVWGAWGLSGSRGVMASAAAVMVAVMALHSQFEYPLWYAYFLLPTGFLWGLSLALAAPTQASPKRRVPRVSFDTQRGAGMVLGALVAIGGLAAALDYMRVVVIFTPMADSGPLAQRIQAGQRSVFFSHQAHYAQATTQNLPGEVLPSIRVAAHNLIDSRLLVVWAQAYAAQGDLDRARYLAQRLREFRPNDALFAPCRPGGNAGGTAVPFQCTSPARMLSPDDFVGAD